MWKDAFEERKRSGFVFHNQLSFFRLPHPGVRARRHDGLAEPGKREVSVNIRGGGLSTGPLTSYACTFISCTRVILTGGNEREGICYFCRGLLPWWRVARTNT